MVLRKAGWWVWLYYWLQPWRNQKANSMSSLLDYFFYISCIRYKLCKVDFVMVSWLLYVSISKYRDGQTNWSIPSKSNVQESIIIEKRHVLKYLEVIFADFLALMLTSLYCILQQKLWKNRFVQKNNWCTGALNNFFFYCSQYLWFSKQDITAFILKQTKLFDKFKMPNIQGPNAMDCQVNAILLLQEPIPISFAELWPSNEKDMRKDFCRRPVYIPNLDLKVVFPVAMNFESIWQISCSRILIFFYFLCFFLYFFFQKFLVIYVPAGKAFLLINYINKLSPRISLLFLLRHQCDAG